MKKEEVIALQKDENTAETIMTNLSKTPRKIIPFKEDIGQQYVNEYKNTYPFSGITRVLVDKTTGEIVTYLNEEDGTLDINMNLVQNPENYETMVKFPAFYAKREWNGDTWTDSILVKKPTQIQSKEYKVMDCFIREDGTIRPYVLVGAFLASEVAGQLRSIAGTKPSVSKTIANFRDLARQGRDSKWNILDFNTLTMLQFIYKIAFSDTNSQAVIGEGWTNKTEAPVNGATLKLGNRSGYLGVNGNPISMLGLENFYGGCWQFIDGFFVKDDGYYIAKYPSHYGDILKHIHYPATPVMGSADNQHQEFYFKNVEKIGLTNIPRSTGGNANGFYTDYFWSHRKTQQNICLFGSAWNYGLLAGAFCLNLNYSVSTASSLISARLVYLP